MGLPAKRELYSRKTNLTPSRGKEHCLPATEQGSSIGWLAYEGCVGGVFDMDGLNHGLRPS